MNKVEEIILKKEIELFLEYAISDNTAGCKKIIDAQNNANFLLYGFEDSHTIKIHSGTVFDDYTIETMYKINLLEILSSTPRFHSYLKDCLADWTISNSLMSNENNKRDCAFLTFDSMIKKEVNSHNLLRSLSGSNNALIDYINNKIEEVKIQKKSNNVSPSM